ncbi:AT-rich interactive domain-containing protein 2-like [Hibiscus syriacus]|uniref:AT-rich interactive domain-containing protein 2-like n=1 Tax=Hibiscus syriacus TaxID=106335 RepID=UPI001920FCC7|nr:AT-rich interactive domain-containing protein 2-like [Hibiscus syriacus]
MYKKNVLKEIGETVVQAIKMDYNTDKGHWRSSVLSTYCDSATLGLVFNYNVNIHVPIGPLFQVEVPEWTGGASESDAKWLGTRVWPWEKREHKFMIKRDRIGKGRQDSCGCHIRDSIQCVRFHVTEKRLRVKLELGFAFYRWKFNKMGEEVAFAWKEEEEKVFSCIAKSNPLSPWDEIGKHFHNKSREELVCYYFIVFLLQHKTYRNRVTPSNNNSDDDDEEIGVEAEAIRKGIERKPTKSTSILISPKKKEKKSKMVVENESFSGKDFVLCSNLRRKGRRTGHTFSLLQFGCSSSVFV